MKKTKYNKYDILEIVWLDSHSGGGWKTPNEIKQWITRASNDFIITTVGYYFHEDNDFIRICQSYDRQSIEEGDGNKDALFAIAKPCIKSIKRIRKTQTKN